jgi:hypothetical protein
VSSPTPTGWAAPVVDTGARLDHADLARNIWTNFAEVPGNRVDDDHNGYTDDVHGVDLSSKQARQQLRDDCSASSPRAAAARSATVPALGAHGPHRPAGDRHPLHPGHPSRSSTHAALT